MLASSLAKLVSRNCKTRKTRSFNGYSLIHGYKKVTVLSRQKVLGWGKPKQAETQNRNQPVADTNSL